MRILPCLLIVSAVGCAVDERFISLHMKADDPAEPSRVTTVILGNGLRIVTFADPRSALVSLDLRYEVGAADDPVAQPGDALAVGHLLVDAARRDRGSGAAVDVALTRELSVGLDHTELATTTTRPALVAALELEARRLETTCDDFEPAALDRARTAALLDLSSMPRGIAAAIWGGDHPYAHPIATGALAAATTEQLCAFYTAHYTPATATLVVTGRIDGPLLTQLRARFETIPARGATVRPAVAPITATETWLTTPVLGLATPAAALVFPLPPRAEPHDVISDLAIHLLETIKGFHVVVTGGDRARALLVAVDATDAAHLGDAHDRVREVIDQLAEIDELDLALADDRLDTAQQLDDVFTRGALLARATALRTQRDYKIPDGSVRLWLTTNLAAGKARRLDLVPSGRPFGPIEALAAAPAVTVPVPADPTAELPPLAVVPHTAEQFMLQSGLRVILAPDPTSVAVDVRVVLLAGTAQAPSDEVGLRAATELVSNGGNSIGSEAADRLAYYGNLAYHSTVDVSATTTRFRTVGLARDATWHVFALAWLMTTGHYRAQTIDRDRLAAFQHAAYRPRGATLIVAGGFDPIAVKAAIATWFNDWDGTGGHALPTRPRAFTQVVGDNVDSDTISATFTFRPLARGDRPELRAARDIVARWVRTRLSAALAAVGDVDTAYEPRRDETMTIALELGAHAAPWGIATFRKVLGELRGEPPSPEALADARRRAIAMMLAAPARASDRAQQLQRAMEMGIPLERVERDAASAAVALTKITADDVHAAAASVLEPEDQQLVLRGPRDAGEAVVRAIGIDPGAIEWLTPLAKQ